MLLLPLLLIGGLALIAYRFAHRHAAVSGGTMGQGPRTAMSAAPFWPTSTEGKLGVAAFVLNFVPIALVNVVQVPFLRWALLVASLGLTGVARFTKDDRSTSVLAAFAICAIGALASVLFVLGEVFIGHD